MKLIVEGMTCGHCVRTITAAIQQLDPSAQVEVDLAAEEVRIAGRIEAASAVKAIQNEGYVVVSILESGPNGTTSEQTASKNCCGTCHT